MAASQNAPPAMATCSPATDNRRHGALASSREGAVASSRKTPRGAGVSHDRRWPSECTQQAGNFDRSLLDKRLLLLLRPTPWEKCPIQRAASRLASPPPHARTAMPRAHARRERPCGRSRRPRHSRHSHQPRAWWGTEKPATQHQECSTLASTQRRSQLTPRLT
eukprot:COSAG01_NODE_3939_length_5514_cov_662.486057_7_plen_164_part_00